MAILNKVISSTAFLVGLFIVCTTVIFYLVAGEAIKAAAPVVIWSVTGTIVIASGIYLWFFFDASRLGNKAIRAETANTIVQETLESEQAALDLWGRKRFIEETLKQLAAGLIHPEQLKEKDPTFRQFGILAAKQAEKMLPDQVGGNLLDTIAPLDNLLIVGGKGSGKTSLMQRIEYIRQATGRTIILDSHAQPAQWQGDVIGMGRQYADIRNAMVRLLGKLNKRYEKFSTGQSDFKPVHQFIDEFTLLPGTLKKIGYNIQDYSIPMLTEGRKVSFNCVWGIHSDRVKPLGLEGMSDLKECFDAIIHLIHNKETDERYAFIDYGEGKTETKFAHPGPFVAQAKPATLQPELTQIATAEQPRQTIIGLTVASEKEKPNIEQQIMSLHKNGQSASKICEIVYGYKNKVKVEYVKSVIAAATGSGE